MITDVIKKLANAENLNSFEVSKTIEEIIQGKATNAQMAAFLTALRIKGETVEEITAAAQTMKDKCVQIDFQTPDAIDIVGTGGDCAGTFNISTAAAFIAAAAGCKVAKHGNRASSSKSGAADVLEAMGANINLKPAENIALLEKTGICFMYAPNYHPGMKFVADVRHEIGIRTLFNIIGPLVNPAHTKMQLIGVYDEKLVEPIAKVLKNLGITNGITLHGKDGLDEATITAPTIISEIKNSQITSYTIKPQDFGIKTASLKDIQGGDAKENAKILYNIFTTKDTGPKRDIAVLNAAIILYIAKKAKNIKEGIDMANFALNNGRTKAVLDDFITLSNK